MNYDKYNKELLERFLVELKFHDRGGVYALTQKKLAYNSNRIEGSTLSEKQTASIFETGTILTNGEIIRTKDIEEMTGHFSMFNEMLNSYDKPLSVELIKRYHFKLKSGVFEDLLNGYPVGEFKNRQNTVSNIVTSKPINVNRDISNLFEEYNNQSSISIDSLADLHYKYETIHPFQDGNGRTGRIILFKECLKNNLIPFIIEEKNRPLYYEALNKANCGDIIALSDLFKSEQEEYYNLTKDYVIEYLKVDDELELDKEQDIDI